MHRIKYMIINLYLHIAAPATIAHTYPLLPYPLLDTICSLYRFYHIIINIYMLMMIMSIHCSLIAPSMIDSFHHNIIIIENPKRTTSYVRYVTLHFINNFIPITLDFSLFTVHKYHHDFSRSVRFLVIDAEK